MPAAPAAANASTLDIDRPSILLAPPLASPAQAEDGLFQTFEADASLQGYLVGDKGKNAKFGLPAPMAAGQKMRNHCLPLAAFIHRYLLRNAAEGMSGLRPVTVAAADPAINVWGMRRTADFRAHEPEIYLNLENCALTAAASADPKEHMGLATWMLRNKAWVLAVNAGTFPLGIDDLGVAAGLWDKASDGVSDGDGSDEAADSDDGGDAAAAGSADAGGDSSAAGSDAVGTAAESAGSDAVGTAAEGAASDG